MKLAKLMLNLGACDNWLKQCKCGHRLDKIESK